MQGFAIVADRWQVGLGDHAAGRALVIEGVGGMAIHQLDEGNGGRAGGDGTVAEIDIAAAQRLAQHIAHHVVGKACEEARVHAEAPERDGRIENGATGIGRKALFAKRGFTRKHVDKSFAAAQDHGFPPKEFACFRQE